MEALSELELLLLPYFFNPRFFFSSWTRKRSLLPRQWGSAHKRKGPEH